MFRKWIILGMAALLWLTAACAPTGQTVAPDKDCPESKPAPGSPLKMLDKSDKG